MVVVLGVDGVADFNALHSRKHDHEVQLYAFDIMALDGEDLRALPPSMRKTNLARLLARRGIFVAPFEAGEIGPDLFRAACGMGLEGLVSKPRDRPYQAECLFFVSASKSADRSSFMAPAAPIGLSFPGATSGSVIEIEVPFPRAEASVIRPPSCLVTRLWTM